MTKKLETWSPKQRAQHEAKRDIIREALTLRHEFENSRMVVVGDCTLDRLIQAAKRLRDARRRGP